MRIAPAGLFDFGDASSPFPVLLAGDGARHLAEGPTLGTLRDAEADGQPDAAAAGDDLLELADDDGVSGWTNFRVGALDAHVTVNVQNAPASARLDAWIDFNGDGSWGGPFERIAGGLSVSEGDNGLAPV